MNFNPILLPFSRQENLVRFSLSWTKKGLDATNVGYTDPEILPVM